MDEKEENKHLTMVMCFVLFTFIALVLLNLFEDYLPKYGNYVEKGTYEIVGIEKYLGTRCREESQTYWIYHYIDGQTVKKIKFDYDDLPEIEIADTEIPLIVIEDEIKVLGREKVYKIRASNEWLKTHYSKVDEVGEIEE